MAVIVDGGRVRLHGEVYGSLQGATAALDPEADAEGFWSVDGPDGRTALSDLV